MQLTNMHNLPEVLVRAVLNDPYPHGKTGDISVTQLIKPPRIRQLEIRHRDEIVEDVSERLWALDGQADHHHLERAALPNALAEERLSCEVLGWRVTGQLDLYEEPGVLSDYKRTSVWAVIGGVKPEWEAQLNLLAHLVRQAGFPVQRLQIVALLRDWSRSKARQGGNYPQLPAAVVPVPLWSPEQAAGYLESRVDLHQRAERLPDDELPLCTDEERWRRPTTYAVMGDWRKTAIRVTEDRDEADRIMEAEAAKVAGSRKRVYLEVRPGEAVRCREYCRVAPFCNQWQAELAGEAAG